MIVYGEFSVEEIIELINVRTGRRVPLSSNGKTYNVNVNSDRLILFSKNKKCVNCGLVGSIFRLESSSKKDPMPHLNLYGVSNNELVLMTKDHIYPKSKGGSDSLLNLQTLCYKCNQIKSDLVPYSL